MNASKSKTKLQSVMELLQSTNKKALLTLMGLAVFSFALNISCSTELEPGEGNRAFNPSSGNPNDDSSGGDNGGNGLACQQIRQGSNRGIVEPFGGWSDFTPTRLIINELDGDTHDPFVRVEDLDNPTHLIFDFLDRLPDSQLCVTWSINGFLENLTTRCFGIRVRNDPSYGQEYFSRVEILSDADGAEFFFQDTESCFSRPPL